MPSSSLLRELRRRLGNPAPDLPIEKLRRQYAFLRLPPKVLDEPTERERYGFNLRLYVLASSIGVVGVVWALGLIAILLVRPAQFCLNSADWAWPWNASLLSAVSPGQLEQIPSDSICLVKSSSNWSSAVWLLWLFWRACIELVRRDRYDTKKRPLVILLLVVGGAWWVAAAPLDPSGGILLQPSVVDPPWLGAIEKSILISLAYASSGITLFYANTRRLSP